MLHLLLGSTDGRRGTDDFRLREAYRGLRTRLDNDGMLETNTSELPARGLAPDLLVQHITTPPFLASARLVVVEGLLGALGGARGVVATWQPLLDAIPLMPPETHLVLVEPAPTREACMALGRSPLLRELRALPGVDEQSFMELQMRGRNNEVARWIEQRAGQRGIELERGVSEELSQLIGPNLWALSNEVDKLGQHAAGRAVTLADVSALTTQAREADIFELVDAVAEGRTATGLVLARRMVEDGTDPPVRIQGMLARQIRNIVRAGELLEERAEERAIGEATGVRHSFPLGRLIRQARSIPRSAAEQALREIERSDHAVKTGALNDDLALELLICRLAALARARPVAPHRAAAR